MIPYRIETLPCFTPWANRLLVAATIATSVAIETGSIPPELAERYFVLGTGHPLAFLGHLFAHGGLLHLAGNMLFLWIFGNAVCASVGNLLYLALYLLFGATAGAIHLMVSGEPVVGASGAITGVVALAVVLYPTSRVSVFYVLGVLPRTFQAPLWAVALYWTLWDVLGAAFHLSHIAYWAHLGGTACGLVIGLALLSRNLVVLTEFDNASLLDLLLRRQPPHQAAARRIASPSAAVEQAFAAAAYAPTAAAPPTPLRFTPSRLGPAAGTLVVKPEYYVYDGGEPRGPFSGIELAVELARAPADAEWWYWTKGMPEWRPAVEFVPGNH